MKCKNIILFVIFATLSFNSMAQDAGSKFSIELSIGPSFATQELAGSSLNTGAGSEVVFHYRFMPHLGAYAGWGYNRHSSDNSFAGSDMDFEETGYVFGLQFKHPLGNLPVSYYVRGAGLYNHIETENSDGDIVNDTGHGLGWQLAGGIDIPVGKGWSLTPGLKFNALSRDFDNGTINRNLDLNYVTARVGILKGF
jgi:hypothetical protein